MHHQVWFTVLWFNSLVLFLPISMLLLYKWPDLWHLLLSLFLGILTGIFDLRTDEIQFPALLLLVFGFFLGFSQPKNAWRWALMLGVWVPTFEMARIVMEGSMDKFISEGIGSLLALVFAFAGSYAGTFLQTVIRKKKVTSNTQPQT